MQRGSMSRLDESACLRSLLKARAHGASDDFF
jgi:hypothetical protein